MLFPPIIVMIDRFHLFYWPYLKLLNAFLQTPLHFALILSLEIHHAKEAIILRLGTLNWSVRRLILNDSLE